MLNGEEMDDGEKPIVQIALFDEKLLSIEDNSRCWFIDTTQKYGFTQAFLFSYNYLIKFSPMASDHKGKAVVLMGPSGAGKSTIGQMLGKALNSRFLDADDYHSPSNKEKMQNGIPLTDEDRVPWLETLRDVLRASLTKGQLTVLACSALQKRYREILRYADPSYEQGSRVCSVKFVLLDANADVLADRLNKRAAEGKHFMPAKLLQSQLDLLQIDESEGIFKIDATLDPQDIVCKIQAFII